MKKIFLLLILVVFSSTLAGCGKEYFYIDSLYPRDEMMWEGHLVENPNLTIGMKLVRRAELP